MVRLFNRLLFWFKNSRPYTIPITFLSWFVAFMYSAKFGGNIFYGIISYFGIALVHLATNLADDYFDFIRLSAGDISYAKDSKCRYLKQGLATSKELRNVVLILLFVASLAGVYLFFKVGIFVFFFALIALMIAVFYSKLSSHGLGDIAVIVAYGPLMFEGVFYVMTGKFSLAILILSMACAIFVDSILYASMILDYDEDVAFGKLTLCTRLKSKSKALVSLLILYVLGFVLTVFYSLVSANLYCLLSLLLIPMIFDLIKSINLYNKDKSILPKIHFWNLPLDNWNRIKDDVCAPYFLRFFYVRNIAIWFLIIISVALYIK